MCACVCCVAALYVCRVHIEAPKEIESQRFEVFPSSEKFSSIGFVFIILIL